MVDMRKRTTPRGEDGLQVGLNKGQKPIDELKDCVDNEMDGQGGTVRGIEEKKESGFCDRSGREEKEYDICGGGEDMEKEDTRDFPILSASDRIYLDEILRKSIEKSGKTVSTELAELTENIKKGDINALRTLIAALR